MKRLIFLIPFLALACKPADTPREQARAVVLTLAEGVRIADQTCATYALAKKDLQLADMCATFVRKSRESLIVAEEGVDLWGAVVAKSVPCAVKEATETLSSFANLLRSEGISVPMALEDGLALAPMLVGACK